MALPPSVSRAPECFRSKTVRPSSGWRRPIRRLTVEVLIPRNIATRANLPASATATKYCNSSGFIDVCRIPRREHPSERRRDPSSAEEEFRHRSFKFRGLALLVRTRRRRFQQTRGSALCYSSGPAHHFSSREYGSLGTRG